MQRTVWSLNSQQLSKRFKELLKHLSKKYDEQFEQLFEVWSIWSVWPVF